LYALAGKSNPAVNDITNPTRTSIQIGCIFSYRVPVFDMVPVIVVDMPCTRTLMKKNCCTNYRVLRIVWLFISTFASTPLYRGSGTMYLTIMTGAVLVASSAAFSSQNAFAGMPSRVFTTSR
jgi:hypothetical protein